MLKLKLKTKQTVGSTFRLLFSEFPLVPIASVDHYRTALAVIEQLMEKSIMGEFVGAEAHDVDQYLSVLTDLVSKFESTRFKRESISGVAILRYLMESHGLTQKDLPEIGAQPHVSDVLRGERAISWQQAVKLGARFRLEPAIFMDNNPAC